MSFIIDFVFQLIAWFVPIAIGLLTPKAWAQINRVLPVTDRLGPTWQRVGVFAVAWAITGLSGFLNMPLPEGTVIVQPTLAMATLSGGIALIVHAGDKLLAIAERFR